MFEVLSDPAIYEHENAPPASLDRLQERFGRLESRRSPDGSQQWLNWVIGLEGGPLIGYVQATVHASSTGAIAYEFASRYWGQGYASEAVRAVVNELIAHHGVTQLSAVLKRSNLRSRRLLERLGFALASPHQHAQMQVEADELLMLREARPYPAATC